MLTPGLAYKLEPCMRMFPLLLMDPKLVTRTPPVPALPSSAMKLKLEPIPVEVIAPLMMKSVFDVLNVVAVLKLKVGRMVLLLLPSNVMLPAPTTVL